MAYRCGNRKQSMLLPASIEDYVGANDPVRAYDAFVEALDFNELGIVIDSAKVGNPQYNPKAMLKLLVYGPSYGVRSSRKLEREEKHNMSFMWLMGGLTPDHKTIAEFRRTNKEALRKVLKQCARLCIDLDLIEGNTLFVDGTKIRANASIKKTWSKERCEKTLKTVDERIEKMLDECEAIDDEEKDESSLVSMKEELRDKERLKEKVEQILKKLKENDKKTTNTVDGECNRMNTGQGTFAGYNAQSVVDEKHGLIINIDVTDENNDCKQFAQQVKQANEILEKKCVNACADAGYANVLELEKIDKEEINVIVPSKQQASKKDKAFGKHKFFYDAESDKYTCPEGNVLNYSFTNNKGSKIYMIAKSACKHCKHFGVCTKAKDGRMIARLKDEALKEKFEARYQERGSQEIYKLRKQKVELPYAHIKRNLGVRNFFLRGLQGVKAEMAMFAVCFNLRRMITLLGVTELISRLAT